MCIDKLYLVARTFSGHDSDIWKRVVTTAQYLETQLNKSGGAD